jgi:neutral trehalase
VSTGYKANQIGFGWSNAVYLKMKETIGAPPATAAH